MTSINRRTYGPAASSPSGKGCKAMPWSRSRIPNSYAAPPSQVSELGACPPSSTVSDEGEQATAHRNGNRHA